MKAVAADGPAAATFRCGLAALTLLTFAPLTRATIVAEKAAAAEAQSFDAAAKTEALPASDAIAAFDASNTSEETTFVDFRQVAPMVGGMPSRRTELRMQSDGKSLYIRVRAEDPEPQAIIARQQRRDGNLLADDHVMLVLDVDGDGRNGFAFAINPNGAQFDALVFDGGQIREDWDALWHSKAWGDADGWRAEIVIPLAILGLRSDVANWRFNAERWMPRGSERARLAGIQADRQIHSLADALEIPALGTEKRETRLRLKPSLRMTSENSVASGTGTDRHRVEPGLEVFHQTHTGLRTTAAFNIDFGETEADERFVNLGRFELFRAEKREFFLQDAGRFSFGGLTDMSAMPYYSRRIGLDPHGRSRSLDAGLKFSGSLGGLDFGVFGARVAGGPVAPDSIEQPSADVGVLRIARPVDEHHRFGMIGTIGNPQGTQGSHLWGVDYQFRDSKWMGDRTLDAYAWMQQSTNPGLGSGQATGLRLNYPNLGPTASIALQRIDEGFDPALGFIEEAGVTRGEGHVGWWHRMPQGGDVLPGVDWSFRRRLDGSERSWLFNPELELTSAAGDFVLPEWFIEGDEVATTWSPAPNLTVAPGKYRWHYLYLLTETSPARPLSLIGEWRDGGYYDGRRDDQIATLRWQPNARWRAELGTGRTAIRFDTDHFTVRTTTLRLGHTPSTTLNANLLLQWDNVSNELGASARLRWQWRHGRELLFSLDRITYTDDRRDHLPEQHRAQLKLVWNMEP